MAFASAPILTLRGLKDYREQRPESVTAKQLAGAVNMPLKRMLELESKNVHKAAEPWLDEAVRIAFALGTTVNVLLNTTDLHDLDLGFDPRDEIAVWRTGCRLPLSHACRLALRLNLDDPIRLELPPRPLIAQLWATVSSGERVTDVGRCPWCAADAGVHLETCLAEFFWGPRLEPLSTIGPTPTPRTPGKRRSGSLPGRGLKALRKARGLTQEVFADSVGLAATSYSRLEQCHAPLTIMLAERIAATYRVDPTTLYTAPDETVRLPDTSEEPGA